MKRLDRILVVVDPTADVQPAVMKAAYLAKAFNSVLELFICDFDPSLDAAPLVESEVLRGLREEFLSERVEYLEELADELRAGGLNVETHVHWDNPLYRGIVRRVEESGPDLVLKDTHYHSVLRRTLVTNTDWNLIRACPAPLMLVKSAAWRTPLRVLAALDPGHLGDKPAALDHDILDCAELIVDRLGGELHAVHAFFPSALLAMTTGMAGMPMAADDTVEEIVDTERHRIRGGLLDVARQHQLPPERTYLVQGSAAQVLPRAVEERQADLLVMGAVSRSRLEEVFIGSTAERALDRIACDTLIVKPADFAAGLPF